MASEAAEGKQTQLGCLAGETDALGEFMDFIASEI